MTTEQASPIDDSAPEEPLAPRRRMSLGRGCLLTVVGVIVMVAVLVVLIELFSDGDEAGAPVQGFTLPGVAEDYARGDVNYFDLEHVYVVRYPGGEFRAFYDLSSKRQELGGREDCRILYEEGAVPGTMEQVPGMRGAFVEECEGTRAVWRVDGVLATESSYGDLNEFRTSINDAGELFVDTSSRTCTRSKGVPGIPPYENDRCEGAP
jgi:hypothetical protein